MLASSQPQKVSEHLRVSMKKGPVSVETSLSQLEEIYENKSEWKLIAEGGVLTRPGTRLFNNWRLIEYLKEATRSAKLGTRSVLSAAGKVEI